MRIAMAKKTVTCLIFPHDLQEEKAQDPPRRIHGTTFSGVGYQQPRIVPQESDLRRAAEILNEGKRVAMLIGAGTLGASDVVIETAETLGAGVAKALLGKAALPDHRPFVTGSIGLLGTEPTWKMMQDCDTLLMVGSGFPYSEFLPREGRARGVQIDIESRMLNLRYPMEIALHGDYRLTLESLLPMLLRKEDRRWRTKIEEWIRDWWQILEARAMNSANPINPQRVFWELSPRLPDNCILCADSGSSTSWWARDLKIRPGMMASVSGTLATMGSACPYAVAAKFAFPGRAVIATAGDGAMQMNGNNVLITIEKYWKEWSNKQLLIVVINNRDLNMVTWEERILSGDPKFQASQDLPDFPYAEYAKTLGLGGVKVDRPDDIAAAIEEGLSADRPTLLEFVCDPEVPMLPPHISLDQATNFVKSVAKGDVNRWKMIKQSVKDMVENVMPHKEGAHKGE
jgi:pyruvate dehydrogenase (quinone)